MFSLFLISWFNTNEFDSSTNSSRITLKTLFTSESKKVALFIDKHTEFVFEKTSNGYTVDYKFIILSGKLQISETDTQYIYTVNDFKFVIDK